MVEYGPVAATADCKENDGLGQVIRTWAPIFRILSEVDGTTGASPNNRATAKRNSPLTSLKSPPIRSLPSACTTTDPTTLSAPAPPGLKVRSTPPVAFSRVR